MKFTPAHRSFLSPLLVLIVLAGCTSPAPTPAEPSDEEIAEIVRRSIQYVAMYNVINKSVMMPENPMVTPWNTTVAATGLLDHNAKGIARPNNDTLYVATLLDLRTEPIVVHYPAFDSAFVALETSAYDHYIDIPLTTTRGDFSAPTSVLYYTARTEGYAGEPVEGIDVIHEMTGDFAGVFLRVMPHAAEPERMERNFEAMRQVRTETLAEFLGESAKPVTAVDFPPFDSDVGIYENRLLEVMQFVFNHTTFDENDPMDKAVLDTFAALGVRPGQPFDSETVAQLDGERLAETARRIEREAVETWTQPAGNPYLNDVFLPKGEMTLEPMVVQSAFGPIGLPAHQAVYPAVPSVDGKPLNALNDYVIRMSPSEMPPSRAFWSVTLYDLKNGWFIPNDRKKYSVGENAGMRLGADGGIEIHIAAEQPEGVPAENWLPIVRRDEELDLVMRIYDPDPERIATWRPPRAELIE